MVTWYLTTLLRGSHSLEFDILQIRLCSVYENDLQLKSEMVKFIHMSNEHTFAKNKYILDLIKVWINI